MHPARQPISLLTAGLGLFAAMAAAQTRRTYTSEDYARAERLMDYNVDPLVYHSVRSPEWLDDHRFWYRDLGPDGITYMLVDVAKPHEGGCV